MQAHLFLQLGIEMLATNQHQEPSAEFAKPIHDDHPTVILSERSERRISAVCSTPLPVELLRSFASLRMTFLYSFTRT